MLAITARGALEGNRWSILHKASPEQVCPSPGRFLLGSPRERQLEERICHLPASAEYGTCPLWRGQGGLRHGSALPPHPLG